MPGLFGLAQWKPTDERQRKQFGTAARLLQHEPWLAVHALGSCEAGWHAGVVSNGIFSGERTASAYEGGLAILQDGEWWDRRSSEGSEPGDAAAALALYRKEGIRFVDSLRGSFAFAVVDTRARILFLVTDRFGLRPIYYAPGPGRLAWGTEIKACFPYDHVSRVLDPLAICEYFRFQFTLGDRTLFRDVRLLPPASVLCFSFDRGDIDLRPYWSFWDIPDRRGLSFDQAAEGAADLFEQAIARCTQGRHRFGALLSGGLDSRLIAGVACRKAQPFHTFTFGLPLSRDQVYAAQMARRMAVRHDPVYWTDGGEWIPRVADRHAMVTEGAHGIAHAHGFHMVDLLRKHIDVNLSGFFGDVIIGGSFLMKDIVGRSEDWTAREVALHLFCCNIFGRGLTTNDEMDRTVDPSFLCDPGRRVEESFHASFAFFRAFRSDNVTDYFHVFYRARRTIQNFLIFARPYYEDRAPFYDYDFMDYAFSLATHYRAGRRLQIALLDHLTPRLATVPWQKNTLLPTHAHAFSRWKQGVKMRIVWRIERHSGGRIHLEPLIDHADYPGWFRRELRTWVESILFDARTGARGIFRPEAIRTCWSEHLAGSADRSHLIGMMISFELMQRQLVDRPLN